MIYITRIKTLIIHPAGTPIFDQQATEVSLDDEAAGEFVSIRQCRDDKEHEVRFDPDEWPSIMDAVNIIIQQIENGEQA
jgi:hypothetical protein